MRTQTASSDGGRHRLSGGSDRHLRQAVAEPACREADVGLFFPAENGRMPAEQVARAKAICSGCAIQQSCLALAVRHQESEGIWGGTTPGERRQLEGEAARLRGVGHLVARLAAAEPVIVAAEERPAVVYHLMAAGWSATRISATLCMSPEAVLAARERAWAAARFADAVTEAAHSGHVSCSGVTVSR
ncbi:WhiB family transcriptional regulator [Streptomyces sp. V4I23]|uniref:WhiB family transcriptional regulator n=1 Tax=Streptomyces sp. V4I23 TaxID=3042282 RepID=UPI00358EB428